MSKNYTEDSIKSLDWKEHIRRRPGMYIGKLGDGSNPDDGIYILVKEVIDNSIDEFIMGHGKKIEIEITDKTVNIRDYGRGIPLGKVVDCVSKINTGAKYDSEAFKKSVGLNGVGTKAVNALSSYFKISSFREGKVKEAEFRQGELTKDHKLKKNEDGEHDGTLVEFTPDESIFRDYRFRPGYLDELLSNYAYLNRGLKIILNGKTFVSEKGLYDLLMAKVPDAEQRYPLIHFDSKDIEICFTHTSASGEDYYSFVNGQYTTQGGTHQNAFRESIIKVIRDFYKKNFDPQDIRAGLAAAILVRIEEPVFESQTKTKLGSQTISPQKPGEESPKTIRSWVNDFLTSHLDNYLHKHKDAADAILKRILESERERKELAGIQKLAKERNKKASLFNKKLRDCRVHANSGNKDAKNTCLFITEGDSASGSMTSARNPDLQAVFSLRGKPLNTFGMKKKIVYENEELNLLLHALNIEDGIEHLRYNKIIIATDADVDGMHIRLLLMTFFLQFYPELVEKNHLFILETPLFRVRNKKETIYCYSDSEKELAIKKLSAAGSIEITRFKGLGEIDPEEFQGFIGEKMRLEPVFFPHGGRDVHKVLSFYMGKNTPERKDFIVNNLRVDTEV